MISKRWLTIMTIFALSVALLTTLHVSAQDRAVDLEVFITEPNEDDHIDLYFETGSETDTADFFFIRAESENDPVFDNPSPNLAIPVIYEGEETSFIEAVGNAGSGAIYQAVDENVVDGQQYCYMIGERLLNGSSAYYFEDIRCATVGDLAFSALEATSSTEIGEAGEMVMHTLELTNNGNRDQQFLITVPDSEWTTQVTAPIVFIPSGATITSTVKVTIPAGETAGASDTATIEITRQDTAGQPPELPPYSIMTTVTTQIEGDAQFFIYLPIIISE